jgi:hypothetical protein
MTSEIRAQLMNRKDAADILGMCERSLWSLTAPRGPIPFLRVGRGNRAIRYDMRDLVAFIDQAKRQSVPA